MPNPAYPSTLPIDPAESRRIPRDGREEDIIGDGTARVRKVHTTRYDFDIKHPILTPGEFTTWSTFYNSNENAALIDFTWPEDGVVYVVRFGRQAFRTAWAKAGPRRHLWVRLVSAG